MLSRPLLLGAALGAAVSCLATLAAQRWQAPPPPGATVNATSPELARELAELRRQLGALDSRLRESGASEPQRTPTGNVEPAVTATSALTATPAVAEAPDAEPLPQGDEQAAEQARTLVNSAFDTRHWTNESRESFLRLRPTLPPAESHELTRRLFAAINSGAITADTNGPPI
jgi:hypothetical protein